MTWILRRIVCSSAGEAVRRLLPANVISPAVGCSSRRINRPTVVLPQPDSPTRPERLARIDCKTHVLDRAHDRVSSCRSLAWTAKCLVRLRTENSGSAACAALCPPAPASRPRRSCRRRSRHGGGSAKSRRCRSGTAAAPARKSRCGTGSAAQNGSPAARWRGSAPALRWFRACCRAGRSSRGTERSRPIV